MLTAKANEAQHTFLQAFGLAHPVVQGPMGGVAGPRLISAVANAGAVADIVAEVSSGACLAAV